MSFKITTYSSDAKFILVPPKKPSAWQQFRDQPCLFLARKISAWRPTNLPKLPENPVTVVCISNTYHQRPEIPPGDILIHARDLTSDGSLAELQITLNWLQAQPHPIKVAVAGRADRYLDKMKKGGRRWRYGHRERAYWGDIIYLEHQHVTVTARNGRQLRIYGSPYSPMTVPSLAFQYSHSDNIWDRVPDNMDILITHTPPYTHRDSLRGCPYLLNHIWMDRPRLHAAVERIEAAGGGFSNLLMVVKGLVQSFFRPDIKAKSVLVNACTNGGLWDPERQPISVVI
ncbi:hypothetical protein N7530_010933 [Penicillium desertorum]|uniref:Calcineurin-like phosphoesterase domain-containing protein n=1 Tax=Penicillium desertorum TaxID=1303715 RepID=A0A9X0BGZ7_9EURO|nr:hypothetical protein N7530_010933 [Penicillium desertorum]